MHDPGNVLGVFERDEDSEVKNLYGSKYILFQSNVVKRYRFHYGVDSLTKAAVQYADDKLKLLNNLGKPTYIYFAYKYISNPLFRICNPEALS